LEPRARWVGDVLSCWIGRHEVANADAHAAVYAHARVNVLVVASAHAAAFVCASAHARASAVVNVSANVNVNATANADAHGGASLMAWLVLLRQPNGHPWEGAYPRVIEKALTPDEAVRAAFDPPPSTLSVKDAWVVELAEPYRPYMVPLDVPRPTWKRAVPARPEDRQPSRRLIETQGSRR